MKIQLYGLTKVQVIDVNILMNGKAWPLLEIMPLCQSVPVIMEVTTDTTYDMYLDINVPIQDIQTTAGVSLNYRVIKETNDEKLIPKNLSRNSITQFQQGVCYLIPNISAPVTKITPAVMGVSVNRRSGVASVNEGGAADVLLWINATHYFYYATETSSISFATSVNVIQFNY